MTTWTQLASLDAPSAGAFDFPSITFTGYSVVQIVMSGITVTSDGTSMLFQFYVSSALVTSAGYRWVVRTAQNAAIVGDAGSSQTSIGLCSNDAGETVGNDTGEAFNGIITLDNVLSATTSKKMEFEVAMTNPAGSGQFGSGVGVMDGTGAIDGFKLTGSSNLTAGKVRVLGMA